jgi:hypothetical protein
MRALRGVVVLVLALALSAPVLAAGRQAGLEAADRGDYATALKEWRPLAEQGDAGAQYNLGILHFRGWGVAEDYVEAVKWYRRAAEQGHAGAQLQLGTMYAKGDGVAQDYVLAHLWFNLAAAAAAHLPTDVIQEIAAEQRYGIEQRMTPAQVAEAQRLAREWKPK